MSRLTLLGENQGVLYVTDSIYFFGDDAMYHVISIDIDGALIESNLVSSPPSGVLEIGNIDLGTQLFLGNRKLGIVLGALTDLGAATATPSVVRSTATAKVTSPGSGPGIFLQSDSGVYHKFQIVTGFITDTGVSFQPPTGSAASLISGQSSGSFGV